MLKRIGRIIAFFATGFFIWSFFLVIAFREVPPPGTPLMLLRLLDGVGIDKSWRPLGEISPNLIRAAMAAEDARFCTHAGFDWKAIQDDWQRNQRGGMVLGASTISMQTAKNLFLWPDRSWPRKGLEVYFTALIELAWPKRRIMEVYLNLVEWAPGVYGAEAAARFHFDKTRCRPLGRGGSAPCRRAAQPAPLVGQPPHRIYPRSGRDHPRPDARSAGSTSAALRLAGESHGGTMIRLPEASEAARAAAPPPLLRNGHLRIKRCRYGLMLFSANDVYIGRSLDLYGEFGESEVEVFRQLVRPGATVLDIGANIGAHTVALATIVGPQGRVVAIEPQRVIHQMLGANAALNALHHVGGVPGGAGPRRRPGPDPAARLCGRGQFRRLVAGERRQRRRSAADASRRHGSAGLPIRQDRCGRNGDSMFCQA